MDAEQGVEMGTTRRLDRDSDRNPLLAARVQPSMHLEVKAAAAAAGMTLSDWVRHAVELCLQDDSLLQAKVQN